MKIPNIFVNIELEKFYYVIASDDENVLTY